VGLAIAGTSFAQGLRDEIPAQVGPVFGQIRSEVPPQFQAQFDQLGASLAGGAPSGLDLSQLTGVGQSFGQAITDFIASMAGSAADAVRTLFTPHIAELDHAFFQAFSVAIGHTFIIGVVTTIMALLAAAFMRELPLRTTFGPQQGGAQAGEAQPPASQEPEREAPPLRQAPAID
jgi:hypothetical protein